MAVTLNASTTAGLVTSADTSGNLDLQAGGVTKIAVTSAGVAVTGLSKASLPTGSVLQVMNTAYSTYQTSSSSTYSDTGLTATITPISSSSKILVFVNCNGCYKTGSNTCIGLKLLRGATSIATLETLATFTNSTADNGIGSVSTTYLDSPATTSSTTYKIQLASLNNTARVDLNNYLSVSGQVTSTITLMEIAA